MSKKNKFPEKMKIALELLHQILGHRYTRSLLAGDNANIWGDVELRIDPEPFCTSCQISSMNKKSRSKIPLKQKAPFKWVFMDIIPSIAPKSLTSDTTFSNYLLIVDAKKIDLELLHQRLGNRSTISLLAGNTANVWEYIELRIYQDPFCTSC